MEQKFSLSPGYNFLVFILTWVIFSAAIAGESVGATESKPLAKKIVLFDLPSQTLKRGLVEFGLQANVNIIVSAELIPTLESTPVVGRYRLARALEIFLSNTPFIFQLIDESNTVTLELSAPGKQAEVESSAYGQNLVRERGVEDVLVVSARRREELPHDVPISLSVFSHDALDKRGAEDLIQLSTSLVNTTLVVARGSNSTLAAFVRGIGQDDPLAGFESGVGVYIDDVYLDRPQGAVLDIYEVERIEVLRGPQGTLYGRNTIGGAIKYITKRLADDPSLSVKASAGSYQQRDFVVSGSTPMMEGELKLGLSLGSFKHDGYGRNLTTGEDNYNKDILVGRVSLEYLPSDEVFIRITGDGSEDRSKPRSGHRFLLDEGEVELNNVYDTRSAGTQSSHPIHKNKASSQGAAAFVEWAISPRVDFESITAFRKYKSQSPLDFDSLEEAQFNVPVIYQHRQFSQEFKLDIHVDDFQAMIGAYYLDASAFNAFDVELGRVGVGLFTSGDVDTESWAVFSTLNFDLMDDFAVSLGARYTEENRHAVIVKDSFTPSPNETFVSPYFGGNDQGVERVFDGDGNEVIPRFTGERKDRDFSPRVSMSWRPNDSQHLYTSYSAGYRGGGFDPRGLYNVDTVREGFAPETVDAYELGLKSIYLDGALASNLAFFHSIYANVQVRSGLPTGEAGITNEGQGKIYGMEFDIAANLNDHLRTDFALGYLHARYDQFLGPNGTNIAADRSFRSAPRTTLSFSLSGNTSMGEGELSLWANLSYRSAVTLEEDPVAGLVQGGYTLFNGSIVWDSHVGDWQFSLHGHNLFNKEYKVAGYSFTGVGIGTAFYGDPRTLKLGLKRSF